MAIGFGRLTWEQAREPSRTSLQPDARHQRFAAHGPGAKSDNQRRAYASVASVGSDLQALVRHR